MGLVRSALEPFSAVKPALINAVIDPTAGTESGHIQSLSPKSLSPTPEVRKSGGQANGRVLTELERIPAAALTTLVPIQIMCDGNPCS